MRLSEAIRLGAMLAPQGRDDYFADGATCAMGAAAQAVGRDADDEDGMLEQWPHIDVAARSKCPVPECREVLSGRIISTVIHLNDDHRWTREQIADWVETIEPQDVPAQAHDDDAQSPVAVDPTARHTEERTTRV